TCYFDIDSFLTYLSSLCFFSFFFTDPPTPAIYTLSLHDALPISLLHLRERRAHMLGSHGGPAARHVVAAHHLDRDRACDLCALRVSEQPAAVPGGAPAGRETAARRRLTR